MPLARIRVQATAGEPLATEVNGSPLPTGMVVTGLSVQLVDGVPQFVLGVSGEGVIEGDGIVVLEPTSGDEIAYLRQFLANLDPKELNRLALEEGDFTTTPGEALKAGLLRMAL